MQALEKCVACLEEGIGHLLDHHAGQALTFHSILPVGCFVAFWTVESMGRGHAHILCEIGLIPCLPLTTDSGCLCVLHRRFI